VCDRDILQILDGFKITQWRVKNNAGVVDFSWLIRLVKSRVFYRIKVVKVVVNNAETQKPIRIDGLLI